MNLNTEYSKFVRFYQDNGYVLIPAADSDGYSFIIDNMFKRYSALVSNVDNAKRNKIKVAFRDANNNPRHIIDILRDKNSLASSLITNNFLRHTIFEFLHTNKRYYISHSKLSYKTFNNDASWCPHQDNGYKLFSEKDGFAIFICLEDMDSRNGALQLYTCSHRLGRLHHQRVVQSSFGDGQYIIPNKLLPDKSTLVTIDAKKGDIVIFHPNCIHQSGQTFSSSRRLALIFEVEEYSPLVTDDYGKTPIMLQGELTLLETNLTLLLSFFSIDRLWIRLSDYPFIKRLIRSIIIYPFNIINTKICSIYSSLFQ